LKNAFTIDVEDYYQVEGFANVVDRTSWDRFESRVQHNTGRVLELLERRGIRGTFFVLGCVARKHPGIVRDIQAAGHEVASHGLTHRLVYSQAPEAFRQETRESKAILEDQCQVQVRGYRAATYSITRRSLWALDILLEEGFTYDSSIFPMRHDRYGVPGAPVTPYRVSTPAGRELVEFPISVLKYGGVTLPVAGGGYFRLFPYGLTSWALRRLNARGQPFLFYLHPWEIDPGQPRIAEASASSRFRHYVNIDRCEERLSRLLADFRFGTMADVLADQGLLEPQAA
jgi:polysaccharide deacetylase family protein (PEP-CTERM system associated)